MEIFFSIVIPAYEMKGRGSFFLNQSISKLHLQTFRNFEVIVSDQSSDREVENICSFWSDKINIKYYRSKALNRSFSSNTNNAIKKCSGKWIKFLCQDDFLLDEYSLERIFRHIISDEKINWIALSCFHSNDGEFLYRPFQPIWNDFVLIGNNTLSSPSAICVKNTENLPLFDENLEWLVDCEWYQRIFDKFGEPSYLRDYTVVNRTWGDRLSDNISEDIKLKELAFVKDIYKK